MQIFIFTHKQTCINILQTRDIYFIILANHYDNVSRQNQPSFSMETRKRE